MGAEVGRHCSKREHLLRGQLQETACRGARRQHLDHDVARRLASYLQTAYKAESLGTTGFAVLQSCMQHTPVPV